MPQNWSTATATLAQAQAFDRDWWLQFKAPPLMELLKEAESSAPDLRIAMERIRLASIALKQSRAAELPTVNATANTTSRKPSRAMRTTGAPAAWAWRLGRATARPTA